MRNIKLSKSVSCSVLPLEWEVHQHLIIVACLPRPSKVWNSCYLLLASPWTPSVASKLWRIKRNSDYFFDIPFLHDSSKMPDQNIWIWRCLWLQVWTPAWSKNLELLGSAVTKPLQRRLAPQQSFRTLKDVRIYPEAAKVAGGSQYMERDGWDSGLPLSENFDGISLTL